MQKVTKQFIVDSIINEQLLNRTNSKIAVDKFVEIAKEMLVTGGDVKMAAKGLRLTAVAKAARPGRNPKTGEDFMIEERVSLSYKAIKSSETGCGRIPENAVTGVRERHYTYSDFELSFCQSIEDFADTELAIKVCKHIGGVLLRALEINQVIQIRGFITVNYNWHDARMGRIPSTGELVSIEAGYRPRVKLNNELRARIEAKVFA